MKPLLGLTIAVILGLLVVQGFQSRHDAVWKADKTRVLAQASHDKAVGDSLRVFANGLQERAKEAERVAERNNRMAIAARRDANTLLARLTTTANGSDSAQIALQAVQMLQVALDTTLAALEATRASRELIRSAYSSQVTRGDLLASSVDSLRALVGRAPHTSRFQPLLIVGAGATLSGGIVRFGPTVAVGIKFGI